MFDWATGQIEQGDWLLCIAREGTAGWTGPDGLIPPSNNQVTSTLHSLLDANRSHPNYTDMVRNFDFVGFTWPPLKLPWEIQVNGLKNWNKSCHPNKIPRTIPPLPKSQSGDKPPKPPPPCPSSDRPPGPIFPPGMKCPSGYNLDTQSGDCIPDIRSDCQLFAYTLDLQARDYGLSIQYLYNHPQLWRSNVRATFGLCANEWYGEHLKAGPCLKDPNNMLSMTLGLFSLGGLDLASWAGLTQTLWRAVYDTTHGKFNSFDELKDHLLKEATNITISAGGVVTGNFGRAATIFDMARTIWNDCRIVVVP
jgi:hypothetical protein